MKCDELNISLRELDGGFARFTAYGGLRGLSIAISRDEREFSLDCVECTYIAAPTSWGPVHLVCSELGEDVCLEDKEAGVRIVCHLLGWVELADDDS